MAVRIRIECPQCGEADQVSPLAIGTTGTCSRGHVFKLSRESCVTVNVLGHHNNVNVNVHQPRIEAPARRPSHEAVPHRAAVSDLDLRQLEIHCAETVKPFSALFLPNDANRYQWWRNEYGTGSLYRATYTQSEINGLSVDQEPEEEAFAAQEFDWTGFRCEWCHSPAMLQCNCGLQFCRSHAESVAGGWLAQCPGCGVRQHFSPNVSKLLGMSARLSRRHAEIPTTQQRIEPAMFHTEPARVPALVTMARRLLK